MKYYSLDKILKHDSDFYIIYGSRSSGKSYATKKYAIDRFFEHGEEFIIFKRYDADMKSKICQTTFEDMLPYVADKYGKKIKYYQGRWYVKDLDAPDTGIKDAVVCGHGLALNLVDRYKMTQYPNVHTVIFEEFMSMNGRYLHDEISLFNNMVSTIVRKRTDVKVFLLGNAISRYNPYTLELGIDLADMKKDSIKAFQKYEGEERYKYVIERTGNVHIDNNAQAYYQFSDSSKQGSMIVEGDFEVNTYPLEREGITTEHAQLNDVHRLIYIKYGLDYFLMVKCQKVEKEIIHHDMIQNRGVSTLDWYDDDIGLWSIPTDDDIQKEIEEVTERHYSKPVYGFIQTDEPTDVMKEELDIIILNTSEEMKDCQCYAVMPRQGGKYLNHMIDIMIEHSRQNWLIYDTHFTGDSVNRAIEQFLK